MKDIAIILLFLAGLTCISAGLWHFSWAAAAIFWGFFIILLARAVDQK